MQKGVDYGFPPDGRYFRVKLTNHFSFFGMYVPKINRRLFSCHNERICTVNYEKNCSSNSLRSKHVFSRALTHSYQNGPYRNDNRAMTHLAAPPAVLRLPTVAVRWLPLLALLAAAALLPAAPLAV